MKAGETFSCEVEFVLVRPVVDGEPHPQTGKPVQNPRGNLWLGRIANFSPDETLYLLCTDQLTHEHHDPNHPT